MRIITVITIFILSICFIIGFSVVGLSHPSNSSVSIIAKVIPSERRIQSQELFVIQDYELAYCLSPPNQYQEYDDYEIVIDDLQTFKSLLSNSPKCKDFNTSLDYLPDFTKKTLIGKRFTIQGGCSYGTPFMVTITQDKQQHIYNHTIVLGSQSRAGCAGSSRHQSWILVPKLPLGYHVEFNDLIRSDSIIYRGNESEY